MDLFLNSYNNIQGFAEFLRPHKGGQLGHGIASSFIWIASHQLFSIDRFILRGAI